MLCKFFGPNSGTNIGNYCHTLLPTMEPTCGAGVTHNIFAFGTHCCCAPVPYCQTILDNFLENNVITSQLKSKTFAKNVIVVMCLLLVFDHLKP
uniref:Uncharacterized protein n=1 Tax=Pararge aegeria TaxID=116150 RepID=S4PEV3_9NEOP